MSNFFCGGVEAWEDPVSGRQAQSTGTRLRESLGDALGSASRGLCRRSCGDAQRKAGIAAGTSAIPVSVSPSVLPMWANCERTAQRNVRYALSFCRSVTQW